MENGGRDGGNGRREGKEMEGGVEEMGKGWRKWGRGGGNEERGEENGEGMEEMGKGWREGWRKCEEGCKEMGEMEGGVVEMGGRGGGTHDKTALVFPQ